VIGPPRPFWQQHALAASAQHNNGRPLAQHRLFCDKFSVQRGSGCQPVMPPRSHNTPHICICRTTHQGSGLPHPLAFKLMCWQHGDHTCSQHATTHSGMSQAWHHHPFSGMCAGRPGPPRVPRVCSTVDSPPCHSHTQLQQHFNNTHNERLPFYLPSCPTSARQI
jgi:hypothetical protein